MDGAVEAAGRAGTSSPGAMKDSERRLEGKQNEVGKIVAVGGRRWREQFLILLLNSQSKSNTVHCVHARAGKLYRLSFN